MFFSSYCIGAFVFTCNDDTHSFDVELDPCGDDSAINIPSLDALRSLFVLRRFPFPAFFHFSVVSNNELTLLLAPFCLSVLFPWPGGFTTGFPH